MSFPKNNKFWNHPNSVKTRFQKGHGALRPRTGQWLKCEICTTPFYAKACHIDRNYNRKYCSRKCMGISRQGQITPPNVREKLRTASLKAGCMPPHRKGKDHYNWQGGITPMAMKVRNSPEYKKWRLAVYRRDHYTCQVCRQHGGDIEADHIKSFSKYPKLRLEVSNGRTLCKSCHRKTPNWCGRSSRPELSTTSLL